MVKKVLLLILVILGLGALTGWLFRVEILDFMCGTTPPASTAQIKEALEGGAMLLDVRMYVETRKQDADLIPGAENTPLLRLPWLLDTLPRDQTIITFCVSGKRAGKAAGILTAHDFKALSGGGIAHMRKILRTIGPSPRDRPDDPPLEQPKRGTHNNKNSRTGRPILKVIIVGGVAGGASCAARLRRLDEKAEILMVERGPYVSYANCGLPYHVGGVIEKESKLLVANEQMFRALFGIDARTNCEAVAIDPKNKTVDLKNVTTGEVTTESYDKLVLSPGAASVRPPLPGIDLPGIFQVRTVPDARTIREWIEKGTEFLAGMFNYSGIQMVKPQRRAVVVGGGFIGLETAENLVHARLRRDAHPEARLSSWPRWTRRSRASSRAM